MSNLFPRILRTVTIILLFTATGRDVCAQKPPSQAENPKWSGPRMCLKVVGDNSDGEVETLLVWIRDRNAAADPWKGPYKYTITDISSPYEPSVTRYSGDLMKSGGGVPEPEKFNQLKGLHFYRDRRDSLFISIIIPRNTSYGPESDDHPCEPAVDLLEAGEPTSKPDDWN